MSLARRILTSLAVATLAVALTAPAVAAKDIARVPICDLEGHCDRHCVVGTSEPFVRCGYGP